MRVGSPFRLVDRAGALGLVEGDAPDGGSVVGLLPAARPELLGDVSFRSTHGVRFAYVSGAMANGIGSVEIAEAMGRSRDAGDLRGRRPADPDGSKRRSPASKPRSAAPGHPYGFNLIHSPNDPALESAGGGRPLPPPGGPSGRGLGLSRPDPAGRPLPGLGPPPRPLGPPSSLLTG